jgi:hypothetical protein
MMESVAVLRALQCHGRGMSTRTAQMNATIGSSVLMPKQTWEREGKGAIMEQTLTANILIYGCAIPGRNEINDEEGIR